MYVIQDLRKKNKVFIIFSAQMWSRIVSQQSQGFSAKAFMINSSFGTYTHVKLQTSSSGNTEGSIWTEKTLMEFDAKAQVELLEIMLI